MKTIASLSLKKLTLLATALFLGTLNALPADPQVVAVGKGSYAEFPPDPDAKLTEFLKADVHVDPSAKGRPYPTNKWWTNLLDRGFKGNLWAYPLIIQPVQTGVQIYFPTTWNDQGNGLEKGQPLLVTGKVKPSAAPRSVVLADFDEDKFPDGWQTDGTAFGDGPSQGSVPGETRVSDYMGKGLANSCHNGDSSTGTLSSAHFTIDKPYIHFMIAGGKQPDALYLSLVVDGQIVRKETGDNSESLKWKKWDVSEFMNKDAQIVAVDKATGGWGHILFDQVTLSSEDKPPHGAPDQFAPEDAVAADWGDWTVKMRLPQNATTVMDATFGRGLPYVWFEVKGMTPELTVADGAVTLDDRGQPLTLPATASHLIIQQDGRCFAAFAPQGTMWKREADTITAEGPTPIPYLVIAGLPDVSQIGLFGQYAYAIPRQSKFDWVYDPVKGKVETNWKLETQALEGTNLDTLQGWLPHHYRDTVENLPFVPAEFLTPRGKMKCAAGHEFSIAWNFTGFAPMPPAPREIAGMAHPFSLERMKGYLSGYMEKRAGKTGKDLYGGDTYWGGKDLTQYAMYAEMAKELGDEPDHQILLGAARDALTDWFTYTPGEKSQYFARYDNWKAMIGFHGSYGSENFTDNHFHYGYFTLASALVAMDDPQFAQDYGPMAKLVAKQYANWDRSDTSFPYLRTFDCWAGHSYAGGTSSDNGNNQESTSEAMQSWTGLFLLGSALNDKEMVAAGAMGWSIEESAVREYWNDYHGWKDGPSMANFSPKYGHTIVGILGDSGQAYGTFFEGNPRFIYGIQWLPISTGLYYLGRDPAFVKYQFDSMMADQTQRTPGFTFSDLKADWGDVTLGFLQFGDPDATAAQFDALWDANDEIARSKNIAGMVYYFIHADRQLGPVAWDYHTELPSSMVYQGKTPGQLTVVAWNPGQSETPCRVFKGNQLVGTVSIPSRKLTTVPLTVSP